ncbi:MAG: TadE/TadG family type IV pilus assembly protein [Acetobacteraceae bacterium]
MRRRRFTNLRADRSGVTSVDFALIALPLLLLVFGTVEFGRLLWAREALQMAAIQGARCIGVLQTSCAQAGAFDATSAKNYIISAAGAWGIVLTTGSMTVTANATTGPCSGLSSQVSEVTINYTFQTAVPGLLTMLSGGKALTGHACFPKQT